MYPNFYGGVRPVSYTHLKLTSWTPRLVLSDALEAGIKIEDDSIQAENLVALGGDVITGYNLSLIHI